MSTEVLVEVSDFARSEYGISAATTTAMLHYGYVLLAIAGVDGEVSPSEMDWLVRHQRRFGAPEHVIAAYGDFDYRGADIPALLKEIVTDVATWKPEPHLVYHAVQMCSAHGVYGWREQRKVAAAARVLGVPGDVVLTIQTLVDMENATGKMRRALFHIDTF